MFILGFLQSEYSVGVFHLRAAMLVLVWNDSRCLSGITAVGNNLCVNEKAGLRKIIISYSATAARLKTSLVDDTV